MRKILFLFLLLVVLCVWIFEYKPYPYSVYAYRQQFPRKSREPYIKDVTVSFADIIYGIEGPGKPDLVCFGCLLSDDKFRDLVVHPDSFKNDAVIFMADSIHSYQEKCIAAFAMAELDIDDYIYFTRECYSLFKMKLIDERLLENVVTFQVTRNQDFVVHYKNGNVIKLLTELCNDNLLSISFRENLLNILNGDVYWDESFLYSG